MRSSVRHAAVSSPTPLLTSTFPPVSQAVVRTTSIVASGCASFPHFVPSSCFAYTPSSLCQRSFTTSAVRRRLQRQSVAPTSAAQPPEDRTASPAIDSYAPVPPTFVHTESGLWIDKTLPRPFDTILIANRGEIACRVIRTCRELGVRTVAVYSDADVDALHVQMADTAVRIGPPLAAQSYLRADAILAAAKQTGAQAIHPGYGFLSENASFARSCEEAGIKFIGPPVSAIEAMGSKSASKDIMIAAGVPVVPGYHGSDQSVAVLKREAERVGYPIMMKAWMGGGGKGMRIISSPDEFEEKLEGCRRESLNSFGDDRVLLERYITRPRHIEFQVFADQHKHAVHLYERDCSVQRRHQKVLEEAPAPGMSEEMRRSMGEAAVNAALAVGYEGAGTVEFIFDAATGDYFFMEMNTRLQVEHPVSEMIMRRDLVQWQLHVAAGHSLPAEQSELRAVGAAIEARIYAENPYNNFLPATGDIHHLHAPALSPYVRVESAIRAGDAISIYYDPMISKLVCWGEDRQRALQRMERALTEYQIAGVVTNVPFLLNCVRHEVFRRGQVETGFIAAHLDQLIPQHSGGGAEADVAVSIAALAVLLREQERLKLISPVNEYSAWARPDAFRLSIPAPRHVQLQQLTYNKQGEVNKQSRDIAIMPEATGRFRFKLDEREYSVSGHFSPSSPSTLIAQLLDSTHTASVSFNPAASSTLSASPSSSDVDVFLDGEQYRFVLPRLSFTRTSVVGSGCVSPMAGRVVKVAVQAGQSVKKGAQLLVMEAMKMEHVIRAPADGVVAGVLYKEGDFVDGGKLLVTFETDSSDSGEKAAGNKPPARKTPTAKDGDKRETQL